MALTPARVTRLLLLIAVLVVSTAAVDSAATAGTAPANHAGGGASLTGTWKGVLSGSYDGSARTQRIRITINTRHTAGRWKVNATCYGRLTLDAISDGSHHYLRHKARGTSASCLGGDIDCLWPHGATIYDNVTPRPGGWSRAGTLKRVRTK
jgi:hypothetical protein